MERTKGYKMNKPVKHKDKCFSIDNFLTLQECESIIKYLEWQHENKILEWNQISFYDSYALGFWPIDPSLKIFNLEPNYFHEILKPKIKKASELVIEKDLSEVSYHAQKWIDGAFGSFHSDNSDEDGNPTAFEKSKYAAFIYLNDTFDGGFLNFKNYPITIKPKPGTIVIFDGGHGNEHEVTTVHGGTRYTIGSFWDHADAIYDQQRVLSMEEELAKTRREQDEEYRRWAESKAAGNPLKYTGKNGEE
jgi:hypothetical protein